MTWIGWAAPLAEGASDQTLAGVIVSICGAIAAVAAVLSRVVGTERKARRAEEESDADTEQTQDSPRRTDATVGELIDTLKGQNDRQQVEINRLQGIVSNQADELRETREQQRRDAEKAEQDKTILRDQVAALRAEVASLRLMLQRRGEAY